MSNEHIERAIKFLDSATGGRDVSKTKKMVRISSNYRGAVDSLALLSIAESLLAIAKSMTDTADEPDYPEVLGLKLKGITTKVEWTPEQYKDHERRRKS